MASSGRCRLSGFGKRIGIADVEVDSQFFGRSFLNWVYEVIAHKSAFGDPEPAVREQSLFNNGTSNGHCHPHSGSKLIGNHH